MKKVLKIIAFVLLIALAVLCLVKIIQYIAYGYNTIYSYFYILIKNNYNNPTLKTGAFSYLGIIFTCAINLLFYVSFAFVLCKHTRFVKNMLNGIKECCKKMIQKRKQKKIQKMKSKIEKMESDE